MRLYGVDRATEIGEKALESLRVGFRTNGAGVDDGSHGRSASKSGWIEASRARRPRRTPLSPNGLSYKQIGVCL